jgi:tripartite-type tricarboxylate transporter receptor subunit TctC
MTNRKVSSARRRLLALAAALGPLGAMRAAHAQPEAVRRLLVGYPAGGLADRLARIVAEALGQASSSSFIVENRPGAGGMVATEQVARADGDGRVLLLHNVDVLAQERALKPDPGFDPLRSLTIVAPVARFEYVVVANATLGIRNLQDLVSHGRAAATTLFYVDAGPGVRMVFESLKKKYALDLVGVPYSGLAPAMTDLLAGRVALAMLDGATAAAQLAAGKVKIIGRADLLSSGLTSKIPTLVEQGADGIWLDTRFALMVPAGTPAATVEQLRLLVTRAMKKPAVRAQLLEAGYHPIDEAPEQFARAAAESVNHYRRLAQQSGML